MYKLAADNKGVQLYSDNGAQQLVNYPPISKPPNLKENIQRSRLCFNIIYKAKLENKFSAKTFIDMFKNMKR